MDKSWETLINEVKNRNVRSLGRMITRVENREDGWQEAMKSIYRQTGSARVVGITGSPGAGKSTLTNKIASLLAERGYSLGIIAVDPSSPFTGGALLGDRLRMKDINTAQDIFIRSMATRGALGGLCQAARDVTRIMDAFGKDIIIIETVGVGQDEVDVVKAADLVAVICVPGQGDGIQALKAGVMEIADLFVVNKADRSGSDEVVMDIRTMLEISCQPGQAMPPVLKTCGLTGEGLSELVDTMIGMMDSKEKDAHWEGERLKEEILSLAEREISRSIREKWGQNGALETAIREILEKKTDPYTIAEKMMPAIIKRQGEGG